MVLLPEVSRMVLYRALSCSSVILMTHSFHPFLGRDGHHLLCPKCDEPDLEHCPECTDEGFFHIRCQQCGNEGRDAVLKIEERLRTRGMYG